MSFTESMRSPIDLLNKVQQTEHGIALASVSVQELSVNPQDDGSVVLVIRKGSTEIRFLLEQDECRHLAGLLERSCQAG